MPNSKLIAYFSIAFLLFISACSLRADAMGDGTVYMPAVNSASGGNSHPILFVTQLPVRYDFLTIGSTFGNHLATMQAVGRGGDLWIRYPDGELKNLTAAAGYGSTDPTGFQGADAIAVRDPDVHWDGTKAVFSMVIGAPTEQYEYNDYYWQLYEITGLRKNETPVITKVPNQPENFNNISPIYGSDDRIIFTTDRPRNGAAHLYPQLDEYETAPTNTGLWSLDPTTGDLILLHHAPSGSFTPMLDSYGRVLFTNWDHLQQDQQADADRAAVANGEPLPYGTFNYSDESAAANFDLNNRTEVFPELRVVEQPNDINGLRFNHFFPWEIREDGTESEVLNHLGRHELHDYFNRSINTDDNLSEFIAPNGRFNPNSAENMFHIAEDPTQPGHYFGTMSPEFFSHSAGFLYKLAAPPAQNADQIAVEYVTNPNHSDGRYRDPLPLSDGSIVAVHTADSGEEEGSGPQTNSSYEFRLMRLADAGNGYQTAVKPLTKGIVKTIRFWDPDNEVVFTGEMWELNPVEVKARPRPTAAPLPLPAPEQAVFDAEGINLADFQAYLRANNLALIVSRDVTTRDDADLQQPFNLRIEDTAHQTVGATGPIYDVKYMQIFQGDQIRGLTYGDATPNPGRRVLAQPMHDPSAIAINPPSAGPEGSVVLGSDGSMAAFVPTNRATTWQLTDGAGNPVVRERYWISFQPGEVRVCTSCHGLNQSDQVGNGEPQNSAEALANLLQYWEANR